MNSKKGTNLKKYGILAIYFVLILGLLFALIVGTKGPVKSRIEEFIYNSQENILGSEVVTGEENELPSNEDIPIEDQVTKIGNVIAKYIDKDGNTLKEDDTIQGIVGKEYSIPRAEIDGYIAYGKDPMNKIGLFEEEDIIVTYTYMSAIETVKIDNEENTVTVTVGNEKEATEYKMRVICEDADGNAVDNVVIKVTNENEELLKQSKTINGKILVGSIILKEEGTDTYNLEQVVTPSGYGKLLEDKYSITVNKTWNEELAKYEAEFVYDSNVQGISVAVIEDEVVATIKLDKSAIYNLNMKKYISSINGVKVEDRQPSILNVDENRVVTYIKNEEEIHIKNNQSVIYNLRVYNEGNIATGVTEIVENIPEGLIYLSDSETNKKYNWKMYKDDGEGNLVETANAEEATVLKTNYLENLSIDGFEIGETPEYKEVEVEFKTVEQKAKVDREIINVASASKIEGEISEEDNQDSEKVILDKVIENNLVLKKFTSKLNNEVVTEREPIVSFDENNNINYEQTGEPLTVENGENLVFSLRVYNESEDPVQGAEVVDEIPDYLYFVEESEVNKEFGWEPYKKDENGDLVPVEDVKEATVVKTNYLSNQTFEGFDKTLSTTPDFKDLQLELVVTDEKIDEDVEVEKEGQVGEIEFETDIDDNKDSEKIVIAKTKVYDIGMKKFVSSIDEAEVEGREPIAVADEKGNVTYSQTGEIVKVSNGQKVEFTLRQYNEGNQIVNGTEMTDNIPAGLIFDKENETNKLYNWVMYTLDEEGNLVETEDETKATVVKTKYLETQEIKAVEGTKVNYADVKLVLKVTEEKIKEDIKIVNTAKAEKLPNEKDKDIEDNEGEEELIIEQTKVYDLGMKKFVSSLDGTKVEGREPIVTVDAEGKVTYEKTGEIVKVSNGQEVEFTLRQYNEGNQDSNGTELTDNIPEGLVFDKENELNKSYNWKMYTKDAEGNLVETEDATKATVVKTKYLESEEIKAVEGTKVNFADVKLVLTVTDEKIEEDTKVVNIAKAEKLPNEKDEDIENNEGEEELIIEQTKIYDLGIKKFVSSLNGIAVEGREPVATVDAQGKVSYSKAGEIVKVSNGQKVEFTLRIYNEGNQESKGSEITDNIPEGLVFDKENEINKTFGWTMYKEDEEGYLVVTENEEEAIAVKSKYLEDTTINPIEGTKVNYADVKLVLKVTEEKIKEDTRIVNTATIPTSPSDKNPDSNEGEEELIIEQTKVYDLGMKKFVSSLDGTKVEDREPVVTVDTEGKVSYKKTGEVVKVSNGQEVEFTLRQYNEGNQDSNGTELTDNIPAGLIFDKENVTNKSYSWVMYTLDEEGNLVETEDETKATAVKTKYLETQEIKAVEGTKVNYADVKLVLKVTDEKIEEDTKVVNVAKAEKLPNEKDDDIEDNEGEEELIIEQTKVYNLGMKKFINSIDGTKVKGREPVVSIDAEGKVTYTKTGEIVKVSNGQKVEFTLRQYNEGNQDGKGTEITDNIPTGLIFDKDNETNKSYKWTMYTKDAEGNLVETEDETKATVVKTKYLEAQDIKAVEGTKVNYADVKLVLTVTEEKIEEDTKIVNTAKAEKLPNEKEEDTENNEGEEELIIEKTKIYDLGMKKFVSSIDGTAVEGREPVVSVDEEGRVTYTKTGEIVKVSNEQEVEFTLRQYNEGNISTKGTEITDNIPEGLVFDKDNETNKSYNWKMYIEDEEGKLVETKDATKATVVKTNYLKTKEIGAIEGTEVKYADVKLVLKVTEEKIEEDTKIVNTAKAEKLPNEKDNDTEDNEGQEELIIEKTKVYDLGMKKFISKVDGEKVEGREPVVAVDTEGRVTYTQAGEIVKVSNGQEVEFILRQYNEGNQDTNGTEVTDNIPTGLIFDKENETNKSYNWVMYTLDEEGNLVETEDETKATAVKTKYLETQEIKAVEGTEVKYADVKLVLKVTEEPMSEDTKIVNTAKADRLPNEKDKDIENNEGKEELILEKTKEYNLVLKKFVSKLDEEKIDNREPSVSVDSEGNISYKQTEEVIQVANNQIVEFTLRLYNEGMVAGKGTEIIDNIPAGLIFDKENETNKTYNWVMYKEDEKGNLVETKDETEATIVKTNYLVNKDIEKYNEELRMPSFEDVKVAFKVTEENINEDRIITNSAKITEEDLDTEDNESEEKLRVKYFDLDVTKYITKVVIEDDENTYEHNLGIENKGKLFKADLEAKKVEQTKIYITYSLKVENIGEIPGYAEELVDYIPDGLELVEDGIWSEQAGVATTTSLANELINPGESKTIDINFVWDLSDAKVGKKENEAGISKYSNEYDAKDVTEGNSDKESMVISIRTGKIKTYFAIAAVVLVITLIGTIIIQKRNNR